MLYWYDIDSIIIHDLNNATNNAHYWNLIKNNQNGVEWKIIDSKKKLNSHKLSLIDFHCILLARKRIFWVITQPKTELITQIMACKTMLAMWDMNSRLEFPSISHDTSDSRNSHRELQQQQLSSFIRRSKSKVRPKDIFYHQVV